MEEQTTQGIDLSVFLHNFRRTLQHFFWVPIVLGLLLGGMSWLRAARSYAPVYQSSAVFSVSAGFSSSTDILSHSTYLDSNAAAQLSATFPYVLQSDRMQLLLQQGAGRSACSRQPVGQLCGGCRPVHADGNGQRSAGRL